MTDKTTLDPATVEACAAWLDCHGYTSLTLDAMRAALLPTPATVADVLADLKAWDIDDDGIRHSARLVERQWPGLASRLERLAEAYERERALCPGDPGNYICETQESHETCGTFAECLARYAALLIKYGRSDNLGKIRITHTNGQIGKAEAELIATIDRAVRERDSASVPDGFACSWANGCAPSSPRGVR